MIAIRLVCSIGLLLFSVNLLIAQTDKARETFEEFDARRSAITFETATIQMRIVDSRGRARERELQSWSQQSGDDSKSLVRFLAPADVRGTGFLTIRESGKEVQRLYLPALNRIQTIASSQRGDRFMGSDFTYEDMGDQRPDDFTFSTLEENTSAGTMLIKADRKESTTYAYAYFLIDTKHYVLLQAEYYGLSGTLLRRLESEDLIELRKGIWRANKLTMRDVKANRYTELVWKSRTLDEPISPNIFTERELRSQ